MFQVACAIKYIKTFFAKIQLNFAKNLFGDLVGDVERIKSRLDDKMPVCETVKFFAFFKKPLRLHFAGGKRSLFPRKFDVLPAVIES